jgi:hypothetical protein
MTTVLESRDAAGKLAACLKASRAAAKVWSRSVCAPTPEIKKNCIFIIHMFDMFEEFRHLSVGEVALRRLARDKLALFTRERVAY